MSDDNVRITFGPSATDAAPDSTFCKTCGGTKPSCCSCPDDRVADLPDTAPRDHVMAFDRTAASISALHTNQALRSVCHEQIVQALREVKNAARAEGEAIGLERAAAAIPTNWCDPLLTGPTTVLGKPPYDCGDIENLLRAVKKRIQELPAVPVDRSQRRCSKVYCLFTSGHKGPCQFVQEISSATSEGAGE